MSDQSRGEGWWIASDGKWYAPEQHPDYRPPPPPPSPEPAAAPPPTGAPLGSAGWTPLSKPSTPAPAAKSSGPMQVGCGLIILLFVVLVVVSIATSSSNDSGSGGDSDDLEFGAFDVCQQFVKQELRSPGSAKFRNFFEDDGEVTVTHVGDEYTVLSSVDAENSFGASLRTNFRCVVTHVSGDRWHRVDVTLG